MKPVAFDYVRPATVRDVVQLLADEPDAKVIAGGQTLGPMLNLRLARPRLLVDISRIPELQRFDEQANDVVIGACVTHAAIEDGRINDPTRGFLPAVARCIAYRAVRNRGTIGGSIAHADPAADWLSALVALGAEIEIEGARRSRREPLAGLVTGALTTGLGHDEIVSGVRIPRLSAAARWRYHKICRKTGEFADAIGVVVVDPERRWRRAVAGATGGRPIVIEDWPAAASREVWQERLMAAGYKGDAYDMQIHAVALERAAREAMGP